MEYFFPFFTTFLFSLLFTKILVALSHELRWLIRTPTRDRWHKVSTPSFGGIAFVTVFSISSLFYEGVSGSPSEKKLVLGGILIFLLGLVDDIRPLPAYAKLVGQIAVACVMIMLGVHVAFSGNPLIFMPLTILWFVAITNAFNLLDNMDGLAGGVATIAASAIAIMGLIGSSQVSIFLIGIFTASILGFLLFNLRPARIFMGDCGSQWIGFMLAGFTLLDTWKSASNLFLMLATPVLLLAVPIFDTALVTFNRKLHGRPVSLGGKDHSSHRFVALGLSERKTVYTLWGLSALFALVAIFAQLYGVQFWAVLFGVGLLFALILGMFLTDVKVYDTTEHKDPLHASRWAGFRLLYKRRLLEILIDSILIGGSFVLAFLVRFDWQLDSFQTLLLTRALPLVIATKLVVLLASGLYRGIWTYIDFSGFGRLLSSSLAASAGTILAILAVYRFSGFSRTLFFIDFCILLLFMGGTRALLRGLRESVFAFPDQGLRVLVVGAGEAAQTVLSDIRRNRQWNLTPIGLLDDHPQKLGTSVLGIRVLGTTDELETIIRDRNVDRVIFAIPSAKSGDRMGLERRCVDAGVEYASMLSLEEAVIRKIL